MAKQNGFSNIAVIGMEWGDEGKGKIIDMLAQKANVIARFNGGNNAGHTIKMDEEQVVLHSIPSGIVHKNKMNVIGNGTVVDPKALISEMENLAKHNINVSPENLIISENAHVILPPHIVKDRMEGGEIGTTARGVGPAYSDKASRKGIRMYELADENFFKKRFGSEPFFNDYKKFAEALKPYINNSTKFMNNAIGGNKVIFEGAQGTLLDVDHGTYPFVTSSGTTTGAVCTGLGIPPRKIQSVLGVCKAYKTRVGNGPFPTEITGALGEKIQKAGNEFGATTGRQRRVGWFDAVIGKYAIMLNGIDSIALTKLDVLTTIDKIRICVAYRHKGGIIEEFTPRASLLPSLQPVYEEHDGWWDDISKVKTFDGLADNAKKYVKRIEELLKIPVSIISIGPKREQTIILRSEFLLKD